MVFSTPLKTLFSFCVLLSSVAAVQAAPGTHHHDLRITLGPEEHKLTGVDNVRVESYGAPSLVFSLSERASVREVLVQGSPSSFTFESGQLRVPLKDRALRETSLFTIAYSALFNETISDPVSGVDNPGYGVEGIISEKGTFLQPGAAWYPEIRGSRSTFDLTVIAPSGVVAVSSISGFREKARLDYPSNRSIGRECVSEASFILKTPTASSHFSIPFLSHMPKMWQRS